MKPNHRFRQTVDTLLLLLVLPLAGVALAGKPIAQYLEFPPLTQYVEHPGFSWVTFSGLALFTLAVLLPFVLRVIRSRPAAGEEPPEAVGAATYPFPWWGWLGFAITGINWVLAWNRFEWFAPLQPFTFSPFWFGYVLVVNAWTVRRIGHSMLRDRPGYTTALFVLSAAFWWYFEYLNRFVQNWYYAGIGDLSRWQYVLYATLPFSTVLPAVLGTRELLGTFPRLSAGLNRFVVVRSRRPRAWAWGILLTSCAGLSAVGIWPHILFPLLWLAPLFVLTSLQCVRGRRTLFADLERGDWRNIALLALAALICGFFWELWNFKSLAKWIYTVPFVNRFKLFEMPILGYTGYLPFGLECAVVAEWIAAKRATDAPDTDEGQGTARPLAARPASCMSHIAVYTNTLILAALAAWFCIIPGFTVMRHIADPRLRDERIPRVAWDLHRNLSPRYAKWARARVDSKVAANLYLYDVPSTEWPMFGSVYYLWATEALQKAWDADPALSAAAPRDYARETIEAAVDLILDPVHHTWVRTHWGDDYLHNENVFFRTMIIAACTSYENLIGDGKHLDLLRDQAESLAAELDASPHGVLEDYPGECYPIDVLAAVACIRRADPLLGTDHSAFVQRSLRAFSNGMLDSRGLPPYLVDDDTGVPFGPARGVGNSYVLMFAPELWPEVAQEWYRRYEEHFWQETWWAEGWREYPREIEPEFKPYMQGRFFYDVDAGPIICGFSPAANAFGLAAASVNGRLDHTYTLGSQVISATWPLPNGSLLGPQILSSRAHAPYLGEACILFFLTQQPSPDVEIVTGGRRPGCITIGYAFYFGSGVLMLCIAAIGAWRWRRKSAQCVIPYPGLQFVTWATLLCAAVVGILMQRSGTALVLLIVAQFFPWKERKEQ